MRTDETGEGEGEACGSSLFHKVAAGVVFHSVTEVSRFIVSGNANRIDTWGGGGVKSIFHFWHIIFTHELDRHISRVG